MPRVTFLPSHRIVHYESGGSQDRIGKPNSILNIAIRHGINLRHLCRGICACTTCHVIVTSGAEHLSAIEPNEEDRLSRTPGRTPQSRLACQAEVRGDIVIFIPAS